MGSADVPGNGLRQSLLTPAADLLGMAYLSEHFAAPQPRGGSSARLRSALKAFQHALACGADLADLHWNAAMVQLYLQDYQAALQASPYSRVDLQQSMHAACLLEE